MKKKKIAVAMSGGVDSTACALQLLQDYDVHGFFMRLPGPDPAGQEQRVRAIAERLGFTLTIIDLRREFSDTILRYFTSSYARGRTPNPCMLCNPGIKFGLFLQRVLGCGMDAMATGHYAQIKEENGIFHLYRGFDEIKDQSYFLARLGQDQLRHLCFPLGAMTKESVYRLVEEAGFSGFRGQESQDICFLGDMPVGQFLSAHISPASQPGAIITGEGRVLGSHQGIYHYTIGQRRGLGIADSSPWYVVALDAAGNSVIVGKEDELQRDSLLIRDPHWISGQPSLPEQPFQVKIRYRHEGAEARIGQMEAGLWKICFNSPQRAVTPGQFAVIYDNNRVVGCGEIKE